MMAGQKGIKACSFFKLNNERKLVVTQRKPDSAVKVRACSAPRDVYGCRDLEYEYEITPDDFVTMLNWYREQKYQHPDRPVSF